MTPLPEPDPHTIARRTDRWTSKAAAYVVKTGKMAWQVLLCHYVYQKEGLTDDQLHERLIENGVRIHDHGSRKRRGELEQNGFLEDSTQTRLSESGVNQVVWRITLKGKDRIEEDLTRLVTTEEPLPVPAPKKADGAITSLQSFLHKIRYHDPF